MVSFSREIPIVWGSPPVSEIVLNNMLTAKCEVPSGVAHPFCAQETVRWSSPIYVSAL